MKSIVHYFVQVFLRWDCARSKEELYKQILSLSGWPRHGLDEGAGGVSR